MKRELLILALLAAPVPAFAQENLQAKVESAGAYVPQGQLQPSGTLQDPEMIRGEGRVIVQLEFKDDLSKFMIVPGSVGNAAIYTHHMHHLAIMRKILLRMKSWTNFIFGDGHAGGGGGGH